jgi:hypothetical protein
VGPPVLLPVPCQTRRKSSSPRGLTLVGGWNYRKATCTSGVIPSLPTTLELNDHPQLNHLSSASRIPPHSRVNAHETFASLGSLGDISQCLLSSETLDQLSHESGRLDDHRALRNGNGTTGRRSDYKRD